MKTCEIIRLSDGRRVWLAYDETGAAVEDLPFNCHLNRGGYISVTYQQRRAAIFSEEVFSIEGERYYFGPQPLPQQPIRPSRMTWVQAGGDPATPQLGILRAQAVFVLMYLLGAKIASRLRQAARQRPRREDEATMAWRWTTLFLLSTMAVPLAADAPGPTREQRTKAEQITAMHLELDAIRAAADQQTQSAAARPLQVATLEVTKQPVEPAKDAPKVSRRAAQCTLDPTAQRLLSNRDLYSWHKRCRSQTKDRTP